MTRLILCLAPLLAASCSCPPEPDLKRYGEWDFRTPESCLEYFRQALEREEAYHIMLCLSDELVEREKIDVATIHTFMEDVVGELEAKVGEIEGISIDDAVYRPRRPWLADVRVSGAELSETVYLVLQTTAWATFKDGRPPRRVRLTPGQGLGTAIREDPTLASAKVYRAEFESGWRILGISNTGIGAEMESYLKDAGRRAQGDR